MLFFQNFLIKMTCLRKVEALIFHKLQICFYSRIVKLYENLSLLHCHQVNYGGKNALIWIVLGNSLMSFLKSCAHGVQRCV
jgi:hypothetical protein